LRCIERTHLESQSHDTECFSVRARYPATWAPPQSPMWAGSGRSSLISRSSAGLWSSNLHPITIRYQSLHSHHCTTARNWLLAPPHCSSSRGRLIFSTGRSDKTNSCIRGYPFDTPSFHSFILWPCKLKRSSFLQNFHVG
jgi:hypothetical protein